MKFIKLISFLFILPLVVSGQEIDDNILANKYYKQRMEVFKANPMKKGQIVFFGNSITEAGKWDVYFPNHNTVNRGISGDNTDGMLARIHEVIVAKPSKIFIMAGINDISLQRDNEVILRQVKLLLRQIVAGSPETKIYVQSTLPLNTEKLKYGRLKGKEKQIEEYNKGLKSLCEQLGVVYVDVYTHLLDKPLNLDPKYTADGLHLNKEAYKIWVGLIKNYVEE